MASLSRSRHWRIGGAGSRGRGAAIVAVSVGERRARSAHDSRIVLTASSAFASASPPRSASLSFPAPSGAAPLRYLPV